MDYLLSVMSVATTASALPEGDSLRRFVHAPAGALVVASLRESAVFEAKHGNTDSVVMIDSWRGRQRCTMDDYTRVALRLGSPALMATMADLPAPGPSAKRVRRSVERTARFERQLKERTSAAAAPPLLSVVFGHSPEAAAASADNASDDSGRAGVLLCGFDVTTQEGQSALATVFERLPESLLRVMLGMRSAEETRAAIQLGVDIVDSTYCSQEAELGRALQFSEHTAAHVPAVSLWETRFAKDTGPLAPGCDCRACARHSCAYVHHLLNTHELLASVLLTAYERHSGLSFELTRWL